MFDFLEGYPKVIEDALFSEEVRLPELLDNARYSRRLPKITEDALFVK